MKRFLTIILSAMIASTTVISTNVSAATQENNQEALDNCIAIASQLKDELQIAQDDIDAARAVEIYHNYPCAAFECDENHQHYAFDADGQYIVHDIINGYTLVQTNIRDLLYAEDEFRAIRFDGRQFVAHNYTENTDIAYAPSNGSEAPAWTISTCGYFAEITHEDGYFNIRVSNSDNECGAVDRISEEELDMSADWFVTEPKPEMFVNSSDFIFAEDADNYNIFYTSLGDFAITARLRSMQKLIEDKCKAHELQPGDFDPTGNYVWTGDNWLDAFPITTARATTTTTTTTTTTITTDAAIALTSRTTATTAVTGYRYAQFGDNILIHQDFELASTENGLDLFIPTRNLSAHADNMSGVIRIIKNS